MKRYIISEKELNEVIRKITDNIDDKARKSGRRLSDIAESVRQAIKFNVKKNSIIVDDDKEEIVVKPCASAIKHDYRGSF
jgi:ribosomal protein L28